MKNIQIVLDSFSARTKKQIEKLGFSYLPLQVILDGKKFNDGVDLEFAESMTKIENSKDTKTSQPNPGDIEQAFTEGLKKADKVIYLCVGSKMSSTFSTANAIASDFDGKVEVWDNSLVGPAFETAALWLDKAVNKDGMDLTEAKKLIDHYSDQMVTWVIPEDATSIKKGGRAKAGAKFLLSKLNMIPMILYQNAQIDIKGVRRGFGKAISKVVERTIGIIGENNIKNFKFFIMHTNKKKTIDIAEARLAEKNIKFTTEITSSAIAIQAGVGALSITAIPTKIK